MDTKVKGIILKLTDWRDADKIASIFSLEQGVISAKFVGVKRDKAKMKSVAQAFTFADFVLNETKKNKIVISAYPRDNFGGVFDDYNKTMCAYLVLDIVRSILPACKPEPDIFVLTINALKNIETKNEYISTIDFILSFIKFCGLGIEFPIADNIYLDNFSGEFIDKPSLSCNEVNKNVYHFLQAINNRDKIVQISPLICQQTLKLLHNIILAKFNEDIKSFNFI